jgi:thiamine monophosphate synthase
MATEPEVTAATMRERLAEDEARVEQAEEAARVLRDRVIDAQIRSSAAKAAGVGVGPETTALSDARQALADVVAKRERAKDNLIC